MLRLGVLWVQYAVEHLWPFLQVGSLFRGVPPPHLPPSTCPQKRNLLKTSGLLSSNPGGLWLRDLGVVLIIRACWYALLWV